MTQIIELARRRPDTPRTISLDPPQSGFLLHRLANIASVVHKLSAGPGPCWTSDTVEARLLNVIALLRENHRLLVCSPLDRALAVEAIEGNTYFLSRWNPDHYQMADDLRRSMEVTLRRSIGPVPSCDSTPPEAA